jgi:CheY-like chemotaxis protein
MTTSKDRYNLFLHARARRHGERLLDYWSLTRGGDVILMSSVYKSPRARREAFQFGIDEFLPKPIDFNELAAMLGRLAPIERQLAAIRTAV